jgi:hypothetical protein
MGTICGTYRREKDCMQSFGGELEGMRQLGKPIHWLKYNIKMNCPQIAWGSMYRIDLPQCRNHLQALENTVVNLQVPKKCR